MKRKEKQMLVYWLEIAAEEFGNHGCNDVSENVWKEWTKAERIKFIKEYHIWNGDIEEFDQNHLILPDFAILAFLAHKLKEEIKGD